ncbi:hypothetical protein CANARDRAFT_27902 [[Candida] arabinofermentans NRRL YB-2248]|uniref:DNA repair protein RAD5 n=1 Tax=[Candida] arabinofermentans NRRL YB-2248 TaxID=983967 RepID=A0A1E4T236_9ASCO|nr:hypothetical protein CANARDRAFT_27902 [[Candida] arabinofermentans NRRL YB-2248]
MTAKEPFFKQDPEVQAAVELNSVAHEETKQPFFQHEVQTTDLLPVATDESKQPFFQQEVQSIVVPPSTTDKLNQPLSQHAPEVQAADMPPVATDEPKQPFFQPEVKTATVATIDPIPLNNTEGDYELFRSEILGIVASISATATALLYSEFKDHPTRLILAVNAYLDDPSKYSPKTKTKSISNTSSKRPSQSEPPQAKKITKTENADFGNNGERYIGSFTLSCWCTRYVLGGLSYGSKVNFVKDPHSHHIVYVNMPDPVYPNRVREIGRCGEDSGVFFAPLLEAGYVKLEPTINYIPDGRLRTGDTFLVKVNCYLESALFADEDEEEEDIGVSLRAVQNRKENHNRHFSANKRVCLSTLFNILRMRPVANTLDSSPDSRKKDSRIRLDEEVDDDDGSFEELKKSYELAAKEKEVKGQEGTLSLNQLKSLYKTAQSDMFHDLPETYPPAFKLELRRYQRHGLTWMLQRERQYDLIGVNNDKITDEFRNYMRENSKRQEGIVNPLWREYKWPSKKGRKNDPNNDSFYFNLYTGACSLERKMIHTNCNGGILADEMGLGKTITTLSLILTCPYDTSYTPTESFDTYAYRTTLIVLPMALLSQWESEFHKANDDPNKRCYVYYGSDTLGDLTTLLCNNPKAATVVLTTYGTVQSEWSRLNRTGNQIGLFTVKFFRIVLDEGHNIRNRSTKTTKAIYALEATRKWALTGTPIINRLDDFYSLVNFLELAPWSDHSLWKSLITQPFDTGRDIQQAFSLLKTILDPILLRRTKNQRDKFGQLLVVLPPKQVVIEKLKMNEKEEALYSWLKARAISSFTESKKTGTVFSNFTSILTHLLRLRQICCHMDLIKTTDSEALADDEELINGQKQLGGQEQQILQTLEELEKSENEQKLSDEEMMKLKDEIYETYPNFDDVECAICTNPIEIATCCITECKHCFCTTCMMDHFDFQASHKKMNNGNENGNVIELDEVEEIISEPKLKQIDVLCPICRQHIKKNRLFKTLASQFRTVENQQDYTHLSTQIDPDTSSNREYFVRPFNPYGKSSKLNALLSHLHEIKQNSPNDHVVVFSQFTTYLDIIETELSKYKSEFNVFKFDGRLSISQRQKVLSGFTTPTTDNKITILLLSLKAGGVGLNLVIASKAFLMDPHWNNATEFQAMDRLHRVGQLKSVKVVRFIMENSIEERMLEIQERKNQLGEALSLNDEERKKKRMEEIEILFAQ